MFEGAFLGLLKPLKTSQPPPEIEPGLPSATEIFDWDVLTWSRALPLWESAVGPSLSGLLGLEIGACGGGLSLWMAAKGCAVICSYYDESMDDAKALHRAHGVAERVSYEPIDATNIPYRNRFDLIMLKSVLGGIGAFGRLDRAREAMRQIHLALKPGGLLLFAENAVGTPLHRLPRWLKRGDSWRYLTIDEMRSMLAAFSQVSIGTTGFLAGYGLSEGQRRLLGRLDASFCRHLPASWQYVMYGAARK